MATPHSLVAMLLSFAGVAKAVTVTRATKPPQSSASPHDILGSSSHVQVASTPAAIPGKRGLAYDSASAANVFSGHAQVTWGYNWGYPDQGLSLRNFEFVPMLWSDPSSDSDYQLNWKNNVTAAIGAGTKHLLAFNEPDFNGLTPAVAAASYRKFMQPHASSSVKLGAPAVTNGGAPTGLTWLQEFIGNCTGCAIDFVPIHWYGYYDDVSYFVEYIQNAAQVAGSRPLWITEFNGQNVFWDAPATDDQQVQFMETVLPWLDSLSYVERYAYFGAFESSSNGAYLLNAAGDGFSESGSVYATLRKSNATVPTSLV